MGKSLPTPDDPALKALSTSDQRFVPRAVALLRLARALNLGRNGAVRGLRVRKRGAEIHLTLVAKRGAGVQLELWAIEKERSYFRELFGRALSAAMA